MTTLTGFSYQNYELFDIDVERHGLYMALIDRIEVPAALAVSIPSMNGTARESSRQKNRLAHPFHSSSYRV